MGIGNPGTKKKGINSTSLGTIRRPKRNRWKTKVKKPFFFCSFIKKQRIGKKDTRGDVGKNA